jgi:antitoxin MazE
MALRKVLILRRLAKRGLEGRTKAPAVDVPALEEGDQLEIRQRLLKRLRTFRGRLPADFKFDRDEASAR